METIKTVAGFLNWRKSQSDTIGFIPTLGALHKGHFSLIQISKAQCSLTVVSIFLNPTQFSPDEDLNSYPNTLDADINSLSDLNVDVLFLPSMGEMYNKSNNVDIPHMKLFDKLEGASRPHFFYGVTTIVAKLFNIIQPTHTFFGKKDAQQLYIIQQMIITMNYPIKLVECPTIRNKNGLAISSRNQYLTSSQQRKASIVYSGLMHIKDVLNRGQKNPEILKKTYNALLKTVKEIKLDYISIACIITLEEVKEITNQKLLISAAVFFNDVRLIDNFTYQSST